MNVANKGIIRKLAARFLKAGRTRNIIAVTAIALTSILFTSVFTIGGNMITAIQNQTMRQIGTSAHGGLKYLTMEQYENFAKSPLIKDISYNVLIGFAENDTLKKEQCEIRYAEDKMARWGFSYPSVGKMPQAKNEIACNTIVLDALGVNHETGSSVPLVFTVGGRRYSQNFVLSGFWEGDPVMRAQQVWLSKEYVDSVLDENAAVLAESSIEQGNYEGTISADVWFGNSFDIDGKMRRLIAERGYAYGEIQYGVSWAYAANGIDLDPTTVMLAVIILALILLSGYLIIYSIFIISVNADIHFYGLLKTVGTTGKQLRKIVALQALVLSAVGIPIGLGLGYSGGVLLSPFLLSLLSVSNSVARTANPLIFILAAVFSLLTVFIGCRKPGQTAARVSPVEAVKYSGVTVRGNRKTKKTRKVTPLSMAWANVTREKRKLCVVVLSLSLSLILLNSAVSATKSFDMDAYVSGSLISDFAVADYTVFSAVTSYKNTEGVTAEFLREAEALDAEKISNIYFHPSSESRSEHDMLIMQIYGIGKTELDYFSDIDYEKLRSGNYAIVSREVINYENAVVAIPEIGDTLTLIDEKNDGIACDFEVIGLTDAYPNQLSARYYNVNSLQAIIADEVFLDFYGEVRPMQTNINVSAENIAEFESWLSSYTSNQNPDLSFISRETLKVEFAGLQRTYLALGGAMSFILALIGILNFINTVVASIISRRRELAMLQSVGMTGKQLRGTLFYEGVCYTALTAVFTLTAGLGIGRLILQGIAGQVWFFKQRFTAIPSIYCAIPLFVICALVPLVCYKQLAQESLVERLRVE
jgi:putative ABC transport system permease protein